MNDRVKMRVRDAKERQNDFQEVELGYTKEEAIQEASRCLNCKVPRCIEGCPVKIDIPSFIKAIKEERFLDAYEIILKNSSLPAICGRVCPQEKQCEGNCVRGIKGESLAIGALERFVADYAMDNNYENKLKIKKNGKKVAIVGSGPAGLTCAYNLIRNGFKVTIYEVLHKAGGVLTYGIPEFRLPKKIVAKQIESLVNLGVEIKTNISIGNTYFLDELKEEYDAVFIASGAGLPKFMGIPNESANGVFAANEILTRINLMEAWKDSSTPIKKGKIAYVIGGGNVAMDAARSLRRLGMEVHLMYRRSMDELPARKVEVTHAEEEGIIFDLLRNPIAILTNDQNDVTGMEVVKMELGEEGPDGRRGVTEVKNSKYYVPCDIVVMALGTNPNHESLKNSSIKLNERGLIIVNDTQTSVDSIYAGGDAVTGSATVILAMGAGRDAANQIINRFNKDA